MLVMSSSLALGMHTTPQAAARGLPLYMAAPAGSKWAQEPATPMTKRSGQIMTTLKKARR